LKNDPYSQSGGIARQIDFSSAGLAAADGGWSAFRTNNE